MDTDLWLRKEKEQLLIHNFSRLVGKRQEFCVPIHGMGLDTVITFGPRHVLYIYLLPCNTSYPKRCQLPTRIA